MSLGTRLGASFAVVLALLAVVGIVSVARLDALNRTFETTLSRDLLVVAVASDVESHVRASALKAAELFMLADPGAAAHAASGLDEGGRIIRTGVEALGRVADAGEAKELEGKVRAAHQAYAGSLDRVRQNLRGKERAEAERLFMKETIPGLDAFILSLRLLSKHYVGSMDEAGAGSAAEYRRARTTILTLIAVAVLAGAALAWTITRSLTRQLGGEPAYAAEVAARIASGDLATGVETREGDSRSLLFAMKHMRESLSGVVERIGDTADAVRVVAREIAVGSSDLSRRTEAQAASLEETAASMEELTATVRENAKSATRGSELASASAGIAVRSGGSMQQIVATMSSINESAKKVAEIVSVIDSIAFQTNILALNAAVEAARAGQHGRGFAVVAGEVRGLAQRCAGAAREIKDLIGDSVGRIKAGAQLVEDAGTTMQEMVASARRVEEINSRITAASREQAQGIAQVARSVAQMEQLMQQNAALVEQTSASLESLETQADELAAVIASVRREREPVPGARRSGGTVLRVLAGTVG